MPINPLLEKAIELNDLLPAMQEKIKPSHYQIIKRNILSIIKTLTKL